MTSTREGSSLDHLGSHYLQIYIEPTPYILGLVREVNHIAEIPVKTIFLCQNLTQSWGLSLEEYSAKLLPKGRLAALKQIWQNIAAKPKVLHLSGWGHPLLMFALLVAGLLRVPVTLESDTQKPVGLSLWKTIIKKLFYPSLFKIPRVFLPGGKRQAEYLQHYGVSDNQIKIANMTVDVTAIMQRCAQLGEDGRKVTRCKLSLDESNLVFVFVGRLVEHKGLSDLVCAFERVNLKHPKTRLLIVGDGPLRENISEYVKKHQAVHYLGRLDMDGVIEMYHAADVAVVPSHFEPWGLVVNEAMAAGLPVIASDRVGSVDDLVNDEETGRVYNSGGISGLEKSMLEMMDIQVRERLSDSALKLIKEWTLEKSARIIFKAWQLTQVS